MEKALFEITTGYMGEGYERCYVWAGDEESARQMFQQAYGTDDGYRVANLNPPKPREIVEIKKLFSSDDEDFVSEMSDSGIVVE